MRHIAATVFPQLVEPHQHILIIPMAIQPIGPIAVPTILVAIGDPIAALPILSPRVRIQAQKKACSQQIYR